MARSSLAEAIEFVESRPVAAIEKIDAGDYEGLSREDLERAREWLGEADRRLGLSRAGHLAHDCVLLLEQLRVEGRERV